MRPVYRVADVRAAESSLMEQVPAGTLMQRAAAGLARRCALTLNRGYGAQVALLVGPGNNGGDALFAGARLARRGARVSAVLVDPQRTHGAGLAALRTAGGHVTGDVPPSSRHVDLVVDGLVGIGARGALRGRAAELVAAIPLGVPVISVDIPSGVDVDTGDVPGPAVRADITITFGALKPALVVGPAARHAGQVELVDIGLSLQGSPALRVPEISDISGWWPVPGPDADKYSRGVVGLATGSESYPGAALLSVAGALAGPTGLVRYAGSAAPLVTQTHPMVVVSDRVGEAQRVQAWVCGCGLGTDDRALTELRSVLAAPVPVVLDADAINLLVDGSLAGSLRVRDAPTILTPHDREFARLAGEPASLTSPGADRVAAALKLAAWTKAVILLKGDRTIVAAPSGEAWVNPTGSAALATGGTGDVLAGLTGSLLAAGLHPVRAAVAAAYVHGQAGRQAALDGPPTALDVAHALRPMIYSLLE